MPPVPTEHYVFLSAALFTIGTIGVLTRRNVVIILISIELILNAVNINLVAFSYQLQSVNGQAFAIFVIVDAAAEAAVGLGIIIALFRNKETILADEIDLMKW
ncbi:MAG TPA: NADH-quinone oxidoreductase subunit NuoK [Terriglobia bacterium]|jgi:NADH-quinone oxidoreductase subunit K